MRKAFASDFDGTLYFMRKNPPMRQDDLDAIREFQKEGHLFGVCSGRSLKGITLVVEDSQIHFDFYILASGALILDGDQKTIQKTCISFSLLQKVYEAYKDKVTMIFHANDTVYSIGLDYPLQIKMNSLDELQGADIYGLSFSTDSTDMAEQIAAEICRDYKDELIAYANVYNVDIVAKGCSKGKAVQVIKEHYQLDQIAGIGDSHNDIPLLECADIGFTFPYAPEAVQIKADQIVPQIKNAIDVMK